MTLGSCSEAFVRLFFVVLKFGVTNIGWAITFIIFFILLWWIVKKFGLGPFWGIILVLVVFLIAFLAIAWMTDAPLCEAANIISGWLM